MNPQSALIFILNIQLSVIIYTHYVPQNIHFDPNHERKCENDDILHDFGNII